MGGLVVDTCVVGANSHILVVGLQKEPSQHGEISLQRFPAAVQVPLADVIVFKTSLGLGGFGGIGGVGGIAGPMTGGSVVVIPVLD